MQNKTNFSFFLSYTDDNFSFRDDIRRYTCWLSNKIVPSSSLRNERPQKKGGCVQFIQVLHPLALVQRTINDKIYRTWPTLTDKGGQRLFEAKGTQVVAIGQVEESLDYINVHTLIRCRTARFRCCITTRRVSRIIFGRANGYINGPVSFFSYIAKVAFDIFFLSFLIPQHTFFCIDSKRALYHPPTPSVSSVFLSRYGDPGAELWNFLPFPSKKKKKICKWCKE